MIICKKRIFKIIPIFLFLLNSILGFCQGIDNSINLSDTVPFNPEARRMVLPNGFSYYLARNTSLPGKVFIRLNVRAGIFQQNEDQSEAAHIVEHIVLRSSVHFPEGANLKDYLRTVGVTQYNANPDNEFTTYYFEAPADTSILSHLCLAFQDWLSGQATFTGETILTEKKIVAAEIAERGSIDYLNIAYRLLEPSHFSDTYRIAASGKFKAAFSAVPTVAIQQFYRDWYRPNLSSLAVVGDIDMLAFEGIVKKKFSVLKNPLPERAYIASPIILDGGRRYIVDLFSDQEKHSISMEMFFLKERRSQITYRDYKELMLIELLNNIIRNRLTNLYKSSGESLHGVVRGNLSNGLYGFSTLRIRTLQLSNHCELATSIEANLKAVFRELERIKRYGFNEFELKFAQSELLTSLPAESEELSEEAKRYMEHFVYSDAAPARSLVRSLMQKFLIEITLDEINQFARSWTMSDNGHVVIRAPRDQRKYLPSESSVWSWLKSIKRDSIPNYRGNKDVEVRKDVNFDSLYSTTRPVPYKMKKIFVSNITRLELANGVTIIIKPSVLPNTDRVYVQGVRRSGVSGYSDAEYLAGRMSTKLILYAGLGELSREDFKAYIQKRDIRMASEITDLESTISGSSPNDELESLLQLTYRYFLIPKRNEMAYKEALTGFYHSANTERDFLSQELRAAAGYRLKLETYPHLSLNELNKIDYSLCLKAYEACFSTPEEFVFVVAGAHETEKTIFLVSKYLGNLPARRGITIPMPIIGPKKPTFNVRKTVVNKNLKSEGAEVSIFYTGYHYYSRRERIKQHLLAKILEYACFRRLREREAGIYTLHTSILSQRIPEQNSCWSELKIFFRCQPTLSDKLIQAVEEEIEKIKNEGPDQGDFTLAISECKEKWLLSNLNDVRWQYELYELYEDNGDFSCLPDLDSQINSLVSEDIQQAAKEYLQSNGFIAYTELPKGSKTGKGL